MSKPGSLTVNGKTFGPTVPEVQKAEIVVAKPSKKIPKIIPAIINNPSVEESLEVETVMIPVDPTTGGADVVQ